MSSLLWYPGYELQLPDIVRAEGCYVYDSSGRKYLDLESGVWCASVGHANPRVLQALKTQAEQVAHTGFNYSHPVVEEAANEILATLGFEGGRCVFLGSGSEAVEYGVRVARALSKRPLLLTMADSYFGALGAASRRREDEWFSFDWMGCEQCEQEGCCSNRDLRTHEGDSGRHLQSDEGCADRCPRWASIPHDRIGGFLFEPGSSSGLVRFPPARLIRSIARDLAEQDGIIVVNEVTTGIGRTGEWFGYQHYGIKPHIVAMGKGVGNGYPVSATAFAPGVIERLDEPIKYSQSHQNDPLGAAVAREVLRIVSEDGLLERARKLGAMFLSGLERIRERTGRVAQIRGRGLMIAVELRDEPDATWTLHVQRALLGRGFIVARRPGLNVLRIDPPLIVEHSDIERFLAAFEEALEPTP